MGKGKNPLSEVSNPGFGMTDQDTIDAYNITG